MECPNCSETVDNGLLFRFLRLKKKEPVLCWSCFEEIPAETVYSCAGRVGGLAKSDKKAESSRRNGKLGGRPRKKKN